MSYKEKNFLPHLDMIGYYQFITFRTYDSLDDFILKIREQKINNSKKEYKIDKYLDSSNKGCYLNGEVLEYLKEYLISKDRVLYDLVAFCIMPNHIHMLFKQKIELPKIMKQIKGATANKINKMLNKSGRFWEKNYYDKVIRDEKHFAVVYDYIKSNPIKVGLDVNKRFYSVYE